MAVTWLLILAFFFAMRSCEYLTTSYPEESKRTKILRLKNITFKTQGRILPHSSHLALLAAADLVIVTFEFQKNNLRDHSVHMFRTSDSLLCPVKAAAHIVVRVRSIINSSNDTKICSFLTETGKVVDINSAQVRARLRAIVSMIGEASLGFPAAETGLHSIRSGAAMAMFLSGVSTIIIQRVGRWKSDAFLEYIRDQVENFTAGVAERMLQYEHFHTINATQSVSRDETEDEHNENGPVTISHTVKFSELALGDLGMNTEKKSSDN